MLFPGNLTDAPWARAPLDSVSSIVQLIPLGITLALWGYIEVQSPRLSFSRAARRQSDVVALLALSVSALLSWRVFDLLHCVQPDSALSGWRAPAVLGGLAVGGLLFTNGYRFPRLAILLALLGAGAAFVADWALRGGVADLLQASPPSSSNETQAAALPQAAAAVPLAAVQQLWCLFAVSLFARLPSRVAHCPKKAPARVCGCLPCPAPPSSDGGLRKDPGTGIVIATFATPDALDRRRDAEPPLPPRSWFT